MGCRCPCRLELLMGGTYLHSPGSTSPHVHEISQCDHLSGQPVFSPHAGERPCALTDESPPRWPGVPFLITLAPSPRHRDEGVDNKNVLHLGDWAWHGNHQPCRVYSYRYA